MPSSRSRPARGCSSPTRTRRGSGQRTRTRTGCSANTSQKEPTCPGGRPRTSKPSPSQSTTAPARSSAGRPPPKSSRNSYAPSNSPVLQRPVELAQYTSIAFTERLAAAGVQPSVGTVGDAYDNALAESVIGLFKTELISPRGPWRTAEQVELATL